MDIFLVVFRGALNEIFIPSAWQKLDGAIRRCLTNRFPFGVIYYQKDEEIIVLAIMQLQREPNYWKERKI